MDKPLKDTTFEELIDRLTAQDAESHRKGRPHRERVYVIMEMALGWRAARKVLEDTQPKDVGQVRLRMQEALSRGEAERRHLPSDTSMNWIDAPTIQVLADIMPEVAKIVSEAVQEVRAQVTEEGDRHYG
jgi:hypothetical protein